MTTSCLRDREGPTVGKTPQFHPQMTVPIEKAHNQWIENKYAPTVTRKLCGYFIYYAHTVPAF